MSFLSKLFKTKQEDTVSYISSEECERFKRTVNEFKNFSSSNYITLSTSKRCDFCKKYNKKIYSIEEKARKYPLIYNAPNFLRTGICPECGTHIGYDTYYPELKDLDKPLSANEIVELDKMRNRK